MNQLEPIDIISQTLYAEARGEGEKGIRAVASVIWNRSKHNPDNLVKVCLKPKAFSCWNGVNSIVIKEKRVYGTCKDVASELLSEIFKEYPFKNIHPTNYITNSLYHSVKCPSWVRGQTGEVVGNHIFFELKYW